MTWAEDEGHDEQTTEYVTINCSMLEPREKAIEITDDGVNSFWIPRSQIKNIEELDDMTMNLTIPEWLAIDKGLI
jgi:Mg2+/Co2+ transporter CorC